MLSMLNAIIYQEIKNRLLWLPVFIGIGALICFSLGNTINLNISLIAFLILLLAVSMIYIRRFAILYCMIAAFLCIMVGYISVILRFTQIHAPSITEKISNVQVEGTVEKVEYRESDSRIYLTNLKIGSLSQDVTPIKIRINTKEKNLRLDIGDVIRIYCNLLPPPGPVMPQGFDFAKFAYFKQIGAVGHPLSKIHNITKNLHEENSTAQAIYNNKQNTQDLHGNKSGIDTSPYTNNDALISHIITNQEGFEIYINAIRAKIVSTLFSQMNPRAAGVASGLLVGDASGITQDDFEAFRVSGTAHIIAISGMHIALISAFIFFCTRTLMKYLAILQAMIFPLSHSASSGYYHDKVAAIFSILGTIVYLIIAGMPVSGQRALIVSSIFMVGVIIERKVDILRSLTIAGSIILMLQPEAIFSPSLQMSFSACLGLAVTYNKIANSRLNKKNARNKVISIIHYLSNIIISTIAAGLATAPFIIYHFNQFSSYSIIANLICIPLNDFFIMPLGIIAMILMPIGLEQIFIYPMELGINAMIYIAHFIRHIPYASLYLPKFSESALICIAFGGLIASFCVTKLRYIGYILLFSGILSLFFYNPPSILISESGRLFAIRINDSFFFSSGSEERYTRKIWMNNLNITQYNTIKKLKEICTKDFCNYKTNNLQINIVKSLDHLEAECQNSDLFINLTDNSFICKFAKYNISKNDIIRNGACAIWINNKVNIKYAEKFQIIRTN